MAQRRSGDDKILSEKNSVSASRTRTRTAHSTNVSEKTASVGIEDTSLVKLPGDSNLECPICLQTFVHPVKLPCNHIFCFLCVKGVANQSKRCALCRQNIPPEFFNHPDLLKPETLLDATAFEGYQWYYQGHNGWWQYDERTSADIEEQFVAGAKTFEMLIAGFLYVVDLERMLQYQRNDPSRRRKVKRDLINIPDKKGVAGLKVLSDTPACRPEADGGEVVVVAPVAPGPSTPQNHPSPPHSGATVGQPQLGAPPAPLDGSPGEVRPLFTSPAVSPNTSAEDAPDVAERSTTVDAAHLAEGLGDLSLSDSCDASPGRNGQRSRGSKEGENDGDVEDDTSSGEDWQ